MPLVPLLLRRALVLTVLAAGGCQAQTPAPPPVSLAPAEPAAPTRPIRYQEGPASADGTGRFYMGREIARVMSHRGAAWLERPEREREERPDVVIDALRLRPNDVVADLGAGTGYFTFRIAPRVPRGRVYAVDIQPEMLTVVERRADAEGVPNVVSVLGTEQDPGLSPASVDVTLLVDAYHEFSHPAEMLAAIYEATRPGGRLVLVEYRAEDPDIPIRPLHTMTEAQARAEVEASGFRFVENVPGLPLQHILVFTRDD